MAQNGIGGNSQAIYGNANGIIMPAAGHYQDMQTMMQQMETLSGWLQQNREEWNQLQESLARVERLSGRLSREEQNQVAVNGNAHVQPPTQTESREQEPTNAQLRNALSAAEARAASLERTNNMHKDLQTLYEENISEATERIRAYCFEQQNHILALHQHYTTLLSQSRNETIEAQLTHQAWQAGLQRLNEGLREAFKAREEEKRPWLGKIRALQEENRILRKIAGWEVKDETDSSDAEEVEDRLERGSASQLGPREERHHGGGP